MRILRRLLILGLLGLMVGAGGLWWLASSFSAAAHRDVGAPPDSLGARTLRFPSDSGALIHAWLAPGRPEKGGVVLAHAVRGDLRSLVSRAEILKGAGYTVLLYDSQAHGGSQGDRITFGYLESRDARAAVARLAREMPDRPLAYLGISQGGAAALVGELPLPVDALIVEGVYPTFREAVENRIEIRLGERGRALAPLLLMQLRPRLGFSADALEPIRGMARLTSPVLVIAGEIDRHTTLAQSQALFDAAPEPKEMWVVPGAVHEDYFRKDGLEYRRRVLGFLGRHLP